jgi:hypothetical protein
MKKHTYRFRNTEDWDIEGAAQSCGLTMSALFKQALKEYAENHNVKLLKDIPDQTASTH